MLELKPTNCAPDQGCDEHEKCILDAALTKRSSCLYPHRNPCQTPKKSLSYTLLSSLYLRVLFINLTSISFHLAETQVKLVCFLDSLAYHFKMSSSKSTQKRSQKPAVSLSKVPSIKEICESLGFQSASIKDTDKFLDTIRAFRKSYQFTPGVTTTDLLRWNDAAIQGELKNMAELFLKDGDNGDVYWGSKRHWYSLGLQYPDDSDK